MMKALGGGRQFRPKTDDLPAAPGLVRPSHPLWPDPPFYSERSTGTIERIQQINNRQHKTIYNWPGSKAS